MKVCNVPGCPTLTDQPRCPEHRKAARRARGSRGYNTKGHQTFRTTVITRDPICVLCNLRPSTVADHYPVSRRDLIELGLNPNDPQHGRGLCWSCHSRATALTPGQEGGWNRRN